MCMIQGGGVAGQQDLDNLRFHSNCLNIENVG